MKIIGRFYFKQTTSGNLIGEFSNNFSTHNIAECANIKKGYDKPFQGEYKTIWFEDGENSLNLKIELKQSTDNIYSLLWFNEEKNVFWGEGFLVDNLLIGDYRDFE